MRKSGTASSFPRSLMGPRRLRLRREIAAQSARLRLRARAGPIARARYGVLLGAAAVLLAAGTVSAAPPAAGATGIGTDLAGDGQCLGCHGDVGTAWARPSSHSVLLDCRTCHKVTGASGKGHAQTPACSQCHSQKSHPTADTPCATCHAAHGSANAFLVRETLVVPSGATVAVTVTKPEGASRDGLARAGVAGQVAGTGICEVCHATTTVYNAAGTGAAHSARWCSECHRHEAGYAATAGAAAAVPAKAASIPAKPKR